MTYEHLYWEDGDQDHLFEPEPPQQAFEPEDEFDEPPMESSRASKERRLLRMGCSHWRQKFELRHGLAVYASALLDEPHGWYESESGAIRPDIGFYLDPGWAEGEMLISPGCGLKGQSATSQRKSHRRTEVIIYPWADRGVPWNETEFIAALRWLLAEVRDGKIVEIGCLGGHGRTGTTLAALLILQGTLPAFAVRRTWLRYCSEAIESAEQVRFLQGLWKKERSAEP